jgi:hypothetical protein
MMAKIHGGYRHKYSDGSVLDRTIDGKWIVTCPNGNVATAANGVFIRFDTAEQAAEYLGDHGLGPSAPINPPAAVCSQAATDTVSLNQGGDPMWLYQVLRLVAYIVAGLIFMAGLGGIAVWVALVWGYLDLIDVGIWIAWSQERWEILQGVVAVGWSGILARYGIPAGVRQIAAIFSGIVNAAVAKEIAKRGLR